MLSFRHRIDRQAEYDPEIQIPIETRFDSLYVNIPTLFFNKQIELKYSEENPMSILSIEEEVSRGTD